MDSRNLDTRTLDQPDPWEDGLVDLRTAQLRDHIVEKPPQEITQTLNTSFKAAHQSGDPLKIKDNLLAQHLPCDRALGELYQRNLPVEVQTNMETIRTQMQRQLRTLARQKDLPLQPLGLDGSEERPFKTFKQWGNLVINPNAKGHERLIMTRDEFLDIYEDKLPEDWRD